MTESITTERYRIWFEEVAAGGPAGYESVYLSGIADAAPAELLEQLDRFDGRLLPAVAQRRLSGAAADASAAVLEVRNSAPLIEALRLGWPMGIASGFKPSGPYHFGHKLVSAALAFFQRNGVQLFVPIADVEAALATGPKALPEAEYMMWAADNLLDWGANGVDLDAAHVYRQSEEFRVAAIAYRVARSLRFRLAADIYGFRKLVDDFPFLFAAIAQVGDILLGQHRDFGNRHSFMVSGPDQDGHMKMTEALCRASLEGATGGEALFGVTSVPSAVYIPHIRGLAGGKSSSSEPKTTLYLGSGPERQGLEERIASSLAKFDRHLAQDREAVAAYARDMTAYIDFFHDRLPGSAGANPIEVVRSSLGDALRLEQGRRREVLDYALSRARSGGAAGAARPGFWRVPERAVVDPNLRCENQWFDIVATAADRLIP